MRRLIDRDPDAPVEADEAALVDLVEALRDRTVEPTLERRVLARVLAKHRLRKHRRLRPLGVALVASLLLFVGFASAMTWRAVARYRTRPTLPAGDATPPRSRASTAPCARSRTT